MGAASKFYIMNENGGRYSLNSPKTGVFTDPQGFGLEYESSYLKVGDIWTADSRELVQPEPSGTLVFPVKPYETFQEFLRFINQSASLVLVYQPAKLTTEYFAEIDLVSIDKGGYSKGVFKVPVKFICKTLFYTEEKFEYQIQRTDREIRWDFRWETKFNDANYVYFTFVNNGHVESPFVLSFIGYCKNPEMQVLHNGKEIYKVNFTVEMEATDRLTLSTFDDDLYIEINGESRMDVLDFANENFFKLPRGTTEVYFRCEAGRMNDITMSLEKYYKGV